MSEQNDYYQNLNLFDREQELLDPVDLGGRDNFAFKYACVRRKLELVKWLASFGAGMRFDSSVFIFAGKNGHLDLAIVSGLPKISSSHIGSSWVISVTKKFL